ncbi:MAG: hypothetical protein V8R64_16780 [Thomasclavelia sp.]
MLVITYRRQMDLALKPGGVALTNSGSVDQNVMHCYSNCCCEERDLTDFFTCLGI